MSNILDYITWRGDLPFAAVPCNEVDGLILAQLSMLRWENGVGEGETALIRQQAGVPQALCLQDHHTRKGGRLPEERKTPDRCRSGARTIQVTAVLQRFRKP